MSTCRQDSTVAPVFLRLTLPSGGQLGPGKVALMETIAQTGSISAAGRALGMSYRRAWRLVDEINRLTRDALVITQQGGASGGGAELTEQGRRLVERYRALERETEEKAANLIAGIS